MDHIHDYICPGAMISQIWPSSQEVLWNTLKAVDYALENSFYKGIQTVDVPYRKERIKIGKIIEHTHTRLTYCISRVMNKNGLNLSDLDRINRKRSIDMMIRCIDEAEQMNAHSMSFVSGPVPSDINKRSEALIYLQESLHILCGKVRDEYKTELVIEPLDVFAHKKNTLGYTKEAIDMCESLKKEGVLIFLCIDTAHASLNSEDPVESAVLAGDFVSEFHFCNSITDPDDPMYGDHHIPIGKPGNLDAQGISNIFRELREKKFLNGRSKPLVLIEASAREKDDPINVFAAQMKTLKQSWELSYQL